MTQITNTQNMQLNPMEKFKASGAQWCDGHDEVTYWHFLKEIYGITSLYSAELGKRINKARNNTRTTPDNFKSTVLSNLEPYLNKFPKENSIPLLVFAYCNEVYIKDSCDRGGEERPGITATLLRLDLLQQLSKLNPPPFCVDMLLQAAAYCDQAEKDYIKSIANGKVLDIPELRPKPEASLQADPGLPTPPTPLQIPPPLGKRS